METLQQYPISSRTYLQQTDLSHFAQHSNTASVSNMEAQAILITSGSFMGFLPVHYATQWVERNEMRAFDHLGLHWNSDFQLAVRASPAPKNIVKVFINDIEQAITERKQQLPDDGTAG